MAFSERLSTRLNPLAERTRFSQVKHDHLVIEHPESIDKDDVGFAQARHSVLVLLW